MIQKKLDRDSFFKFVDNLDLITKGVECVYSEYGQYKHVFKKIYWQMINKGALCQRSLDS